MVNDTPRDRAGDKRSVRVYLDLDLYAELERRALRAREKPSSPASRVLALWLTNQLVDSDLSAVDRPQPGAVSGSEQVAAGSPHVPISPCTRESVDPPVRESTPPNPPVGGGVRSGASLPGKEEFELGWQEHRDAGASLGAKRAAKGNCAWRQWSRLLKATGMGPVDALTRWRRRLGARGEFTEQPQRMLRPENNLLTDEALEDIEANARARSGYNATSPEKVAKRKDAERAQLEHDHNRLEALIREEGPRPDLVDRFNRFRERLGWEPKTFGNWGGCDPGVMAMIQQTADKLGDGAQAPLRSPPRNGRGEA